ncbi:flagellar type III secretion system pore protein FliP [Lacrimispora saccharolytica]|uniref:flagellar type III secretion system pore protein FliP n=1 Tax=Lacrimispora saccharolytica TaxID=84030 RepID=UPI001B4D1958|nr:flagellar type III secretion system pore protein FliP [Lacrimispora saccharolytica]MBP9000597.1 flagellar type III secretion system pore protein FliP [Lachnospiraceae bacterium]MBS7330102.1 flagellar type III secretion system pore protein FliP [Lachnospiraceae bacterium]MCF2655813.1 flagellar type III secretion system pore protein FliP [Lacrimispora saccharolytica]
MIVSILRKKTTKLLKIICLLLVVGILCILPENHAYAAETADTITDGRLNDELTGTTNERTNIREPGSAESADDLKKLNVANTVTVTYDNGNGTLSGPLRILITLTLIALAPVLIICLTSFTRIIIVLHFTRNALNTQTSPPNQVLLGLALFLTFFIMSPTIAQVRTEAIEPFDKGQITQEEAFTAAMKPIREFMYGQTQTKDVKLFLEISGDEWTGNLEDIPNAVLIPSFMLSELRVGFIIGFLLYIPFIVIDMVVASTLMSMGMMMLPPTTISMPFKILLFVLADGWNLVIGNLVRTFY